MKDYLKTAVQSSGGWSELLSEQIAALRRRVTVRRDSVYTQDPGVHERYVAALCEAADAIDDLRLVYVDIETCPQHSDWVRRACLTLLAMAKEKGVRTLLTEESVKEASGKTLLRNFEILVKLYQKPTSGPQRICFLLDHFDHAKEWDYDMVWTRELFATLHKSLSCILVGTAPVYEITGSRPDGSPFANMFSNHKLEGTA